MNVLSAWTHPIVRQRSAVRRMDVWTPLAILATLAITLLFVANNERLWLHTIRARHADRITILKASWKAFARNY